MLVRVSATTWIVHRAAAWDAGGVPSASLHPTYIASDPHASSSGRFRCGRDGARVRTVVVDEIDLQRPLSAIKVGARRTGLRALIGARPGRSLATSRRSLQDSSSRFRPSPRRRFRTGSISWRPSTIDSTASFCGCQLPGRCLEQPCHPPERTCVISRDAVVIGQRPGARRARAHRRCRSGPATSNRSQGLRTGGRRTVGDGAQELGRLATLSAPRRSVCGTRRSSIWVHSLPRSSVACTVSAFKRLVGIDLNPAVRDMPVPRTP